MSLSSHTSFKFAFNNPQWSNMILHIQQQDTESIPQQYEHKTTEDEKNTAPSSSSSKRKMVSDPEDEHTAKRSRNQSNVSSSGGLMDGEGKTYFSLHIDHTILAASSPHWRAMFSNGWRCDQKEMTLKVQCACA